MSGAATGPAGETFVSTGELPDRGLVEGLVREAHERYRSNRDGKVSQAYPALARMPAELFGEFMQQYRERLFERLEDARPYFYPFKRILFWAQL